MLATNSKLLMLVMKTLITNQSVRVKKVIKNRDLVIALSTE